MSKESSDNLEFQYLQRRLSSLFEDGSGPGECTIVVVPSLTLPRAELEKIPGAAHFEHRLLFELQLLGNKQAKIVYVTSKQIDPLIIDYTLGLVPDLSPADACERLVLLNCNDESPDPLTAKLLMRPDLINTILSSITDVTHAYLITFNSSSLERDLALRLGIPLFSCDPELLYLGTKSGGRKLFREEAIPVPDGFEDIWQESDLVKALAELKSRNPALGKAVVKLNDSFAGVGNAIFSYPDPPQHERGRWIAAELPNRFEFSGQDNTWEAYRDKLRTMGGTVECYIDAPAIQSPSVQLEISPQGDVHLLSTHDQILGGTIGHSFAGCAFPAWEPCRLRIQELALRAGTALASSGVIGQLSIDFLVDRSELGQVYALEINLRMGGTLAPYMFMHGRVGGHYSAESGTYLTPGGQPLYYVASDRIRRDGFRSLTARDVIDIATRHGLHYSEMTGTGAIFFALGALPDFGMLGMVAIGTSPDVAQQVYDTVIATLEAAVTLRR